MLLLAIGLQDQEKMEEAESLHRQALLEREKQLCVSHPWALLCCSRLAQVLQARGKLEEAEELSRRALAGSELEMGQGESLVYVNRQGNPAKSMEKHGETGLEWAETMMKVVFAGTFWVAPGWRRCCRREARSRRRRSCMRSCDSMALKSYLPRATWL